MADDSDTQLPIPRRTILKGTAGVGATGVLGTGAAVAEDGDGGGGDGGGGDGDGDGNGGSTDDDRTVATVTLITGETVRVVDSGDGDVPRYVVDGEEPAQYGVYERDGDTYVVPSDADLDLMADALFNVDLLVEQGLTDEEADAIPVVVSMSEDVDGADAGTMDATGYTHRRSLSMIDCVAGDVDKNDARATASMMAADGGVEQVFLDVRAGTVLDEGAPAVQASTARERFDVDGSGTTVAVLDTGIDAGHPDFGDRVVEQVDFSGDGVGDRDGHGTHVAGIAAGAGEENDDFVGVAPGADLLDVKVLGDFGFGLSSDVIAGIEYAVEQDADLINMSLGGPPQKDDPLAAATNAAAEAGVLPVASAGNDFFADFGTISSPGIAQRATTVGATEPDAGLTFFTAKGPSPFEQNIKPEVVAPGEAITAAGSKAAGEFPYTDKSGTSMSAAFVTGIAALLVEDGDADTPAAVEDALVTTADRLTGENPFTAGGGEANAERALAGDLRVRNAVVGFGLLESPVARTRTVTLENTGGEELAVDVTATLRSYDFSRGSGEDIGDQLSVTPGTVTIAPGDTEQVEVTVEGGQAFGYNAGYLTFETQGGTTRQALVGFVRGLRVDVEKLAHPDSDGVQFDSFLAYAHDLSEAEISFAAFDENGTYSFVLLDDGGPYTFYSDGNLAPDDDQPFFGDATWTVKQVEIDPDNTSFTMDEGATVPRVIDRADVAPADRYATRTFSATLYAVWDTGQTVSANQSYTGPFGIDTVYVSPVDEDDPTNVSTTYLFYDEEAADPAFDLDTPTVYHLFYGTTSIDPPRNVVTVDPDELGAERFRYHRTYPDQLLGVSPIRIPADLETFPLGFAIGVLADLGRDRVDQTWYRNDQAFYDEQWFDDADVFGADYELRRTVGGFFGDGFRPTPGETIVQDFNRDPLGDTLPKWELADGTLDVRGQWYGDNAEIPFTAYKYRFNGPFNSWTISVDGDERASYDSRSFFFLDPVVSDIDPGSEVRLSTAGRVLAPSDRSVATDSDWTVAYEPGTANTPPQVDRIDVRGLSTVNEVPAGQRVVFVDVDAAADLEQVRLWYAPTDAVDASPFEDPSGWTAADPRYVAGGRHGFVVTTAGAPGVYDLAVEADDGADNHVRKLTERALTVTEGAALAASTLVQPNNVNKRSNRSIPVDITVPGDLDPSAVDQDSLRLGAPRTVIEGGGARAKRVQRGDGGTLTAVFPIEGTAFPCRSPVAAQVAGQLRDGTVVSGADVLPEVTCPDSG